MRAADVHVRAAPDAGESHIGPEFLLVRTSINRRSEAVTTIEHISTLTIDADGRKWCVEPVGELLPLTHSAAVEWAVAYAARRDIRVVYEADETAEF